MGGSTRLFSIGETPLREDAVYFIAEAGVNHNGELTLARELIEVAVECGADAVKFQTFDTDRFVARDTPAADYQTGTEDVDSQYELLQRYELSRSEFESLQEYCEKQGITFLSTPFDTRSADILHEMGVSAIKLGSGDLTNHPLMRHVALFGRPLIVSTGMATMAEVADAVDVIRDTNPDVSLALLHCTSTYPTALERVNLRAMKKMADSFDIPIGYSDHTTNVETPAYATAAGALIVEKHFTIDRSLPGPDHHASLEPSELARAVTLAREAAVALGSDVKQPTPEEEKMKLVSRKSLRAARDLAANSTLTEEDIAIKRPADGTPPADLQSVIGRVLTAPVTRDDPITEEILR